MAETTFYWHDYETFGLHKRLDRPVQFAGIRTDAELNILSKNPDVWYCECAPDYLPDPGASFVTGLTPQTAYERGAVKEVEFAKRINDEMSRPGTISVGYNSFGFDDDVSRHLFWRNLYDPYAREFNEGRSRWDLYPFTLAVWALRPEGIEWPRVKTLSSNSFVLNQFHTEVGDDERQSFRLEHLSKANGLIHSRAHDAASDVEATIALAKLFKSKKGKLWTWALSNRDKESVRNALKSANPVVWIDPYAGQKRGFIRCVMVLAESRSNEYVVWDCREDPSVLVGMKPEDIKRRTTGKAEDFLEGETRLPLRTIRINTSPFVCSTLKILTPDVCKRFGIDLNEVLANGQKWTELRDSLSGPISLAFEAQKNDVSDFDVDESLYVGGFIKDHDKAMMAKVHQLDPIELTDQVKTGHVSFDDRRLTDMLWRMRARNWPESLSEEEKIRWKAFCKARLEGVVRGTLSLTEYFERIDALAQQNEENLMDRKISEAEHESSRELCEMLYNWGEYVGNLANEE